MGKRRKIKAVFALLFWGGLAALSISGCKEDGDTPNVTSFNYVFQTNTQGWATGFAYYRAADSAANGLAVVQRDSVPIINGQRMLRFSGRNPGEQTVTYLKRQFTGLQPEQRYEISIGMTFFTNAPDTLRSEWRRRRFNENPTLYGNYGPVRLDTMQGRRVNVIANVSTAEPVVSTNASGQKVLSNYSPLALGTTINGNGDTIKVFRTVSRRRTISSTTDKNGAIWILVGTTSRYRYRDINGTEVPWRYYLQSVDLRLQPF